MKVIERRRKTQATGRVKDQVSVWGQAEDSIISAAYPHLPDDNIESGSDGSP